MIVTFIGNILRPERFFQALSLTAGVPWSKLSRQAIRIPGAHVRGDLVQAHLTSLIFDVRVVRSASNCRVCRLCQIMPPTTWSLSSTLLISTSALCLSPSIRALHPLTKLVLATALWQLLRLDQQLHKNEVSARLVHDIGSTYSTGMTCEKIHLKDTATDIWKSPAEILANSKRALPKAHPELWELVNATPNAAGTRKMTSS